MLAALVSVEALTWLDSFLEALEPGSLRVMLTLGSVHAMLATMGFLTCVELLLGAGVCVRVVVRDLRVVLHVLLPPESSKLKPRRAANHHTEWR